MLSPHLAAAIDLQGGAANVTKQLLPSCLSRVFVSCQTTQPKALVLTLGKCAQSVSQHEGEAL